MKISIIINPYSKDSDAVEHALKFIHAVLIEKHTIGQVFFYGYAVKCAFFNDTRWKEIAQHNITLSVCSTIADDYKRTALPYFKLQGLGQWVDSLLDSNKKVEFV
jgi:sulfur relay (sulfurtransferase) complex TusBCD TusD component (DsrE family)